MKQIKITLECTTSKYKPVAAIVEVPSIKDYNANSKHYNEKGIIKICQKRGWQSADLTRLGYTKVKVCEYKPKSAAERAADYEKIKEAKYASGEWQRPKTR